MNKYFATLLMTAAMGTALLAQDKNLDLFKQIDSVDADKTASPTPAPGETASQQPPTIITATKWSTFDSATKVAVLFGDVKVNNPQFTLNSDQLTVYFHKEEEAPKKDTGAKQTPTPAPTPKASPKPGAADPTPQQGGIDKVIAEGNVVIVSDRPDPKGGAPVHYTGKAEKVVYNPATGEAVLSGWPQLQQGINTMVATESTTVIYLNRDGKMRSDGGQVKMVVHDPGPDKTPSPEKTPATDKTPEVQ